MTKLEQMAGEVAAKRAALKGIFDAHRTAAGELDMPLSVCEDIRKKEQELGDLTKAYETQRAMAQIESVNAKALDDLQNTPVSNVPFPSTQGASNVSTNYAQGNRKSFGQLVTESKSYKDALKNGYQGTIDIEGVSLKAPITGFTIPVSPDVRLVPSAQRRPVVADLIPSFQTTSGSIQFMKETTFTNAAAPVAAGGTKPSSNLGGVRTTLPVEVIAHLLSVTEQQLEDIPQFEAILNDRGMLMLELAEEAQLLSGTGTSPQLAGFYTRPGLQNYTQLASPETVADALYKAITKVRTIGFADPSGVVIHPDDWTSIRLMKTTQGEYIWGAPSVIGPETIWGLPSIVTVAATAKLPLTGDFRLYSQIARRNAMRIEMGYVNNDFALNQKTVRIETREALLVYRDAAFCTATLL